MFTGIIEEIGKIKSIKKSGTGIELTISCTKTVEGLKEGDSIAVDGVCQTIVSFNENSFTVFASKITFEITTFSKYYIGQNVNLERALKLDSRLGGHFVTGHIDTIGKVIKKINDSSGVSYELVFESKYNNYIVNKGAITVNGVSLTISSVSNNSFSLYIIPETVLRTNFNEIKEGSFVNLEFDILGKYVYKMIGKDNKPAFEEILEKNGFK